MDALAGVVKLLGLVRSAPGFHQQPAVINGASDLLVEIFGEAGRHARSAIGVSELPSARPSRSRRSSSSREGAVAIAGPVLTSTDVSSIGKTQGVE